MLIDKKIQIIGINKRVIFQTIYLIIILNVILSKKTSVISKDITSECNQKRLQNSYLFKDESISKKRFERWALSKRFDRVNRKLY